MTVARLLARAGRAFPDRPALAVGRTPWLSYGRLLQRAAAMAGSLTGKLGLEPGDRVGLVMTNCPEYVEVMCALWHAGLTPVPVNARLHAREFQYILEHSGARLCFANGGLVETVSGLEPELPALDRVIAVPSPDYTALRASDPAPLAAAGDDDLAWLFYTSGTTGRPKGAMLTHRNLLTMTACYFADVDGIAPDDCIVHAAPMSHGSGLYMVPHLARAANQVIPDSGGFDPAELFDLFGAYWGVTLFAAPTMVKRLVDHAGTRAAGGPVASGLKTVIYGGGPMYVADLKAARRALGPRLAQIYGQGESPMCITALPKAVINDDTRPDWDDRLASAGLPQTLCEVITVDPDDPEDRPLSAGTVGEVLVRGPSVMAGYWNNPEATARSLRGGWLHTGDLGFIDQAGFLTLKDRSNDMIISGGSNIYPREVEEVLLRHPDVAEVSVIGEPHAEWGEAVVAFIVPRDEGSPPAESDLDKLCLEQIARFKRPKRYVSVESLPKNNYGKVLKTELRKRLTATEEGSAPA